jgi:K+-transporting ATPase ATPase C chain
MFQQLLPGFRMTLLMTILTGLVYPGVVIGLCQLLFRDQANGSLITAGGQVVGSSLIGQAFSKSEYFHGRPSAAGNGYDGTASAGSNFGPTNQKLIDRVKAGVARFHQENPDYQGPIPADLLTASGSGLDPHISIASAEAQIARVAKARETTEDQVRAILAANTEGRDLGFIGEPRVNVLTVNLALDRQLKR